MVAQDVDIEITCFEGATPIRILGRDAEIIGNRIYTSIGQLYSNQEKYLLIELDIAPNRAGSEIQVASVTINYDNMETNRKDHLSTVTHVVFTQSEKTVEKAKDRETLVEAVKQIATETTEQAIQLRDEGKVEEAKELLQANTQYLDKEAEELQSEDLRGMSISSGLDAEEIEDDAGWNANRKKMKAASYETQNQQSY